ncbi:MAG: hypothetical protein NZO16_05405 [Deltaproteobacteria bacterium]|nr:hypothetical protein [Deltaproteobacteria bacterium]
MVVSQIANYEKLSHPVNPVNFLELLLSEKMKESKTSRSSHGCYEVTPVLHT